MKSAFLYGELSEEVFVVQPPGFMVKGEKHKVYKLKKAIYGLKQAPRAWFSKIENYFLSEGFTKCPYEHTLFIYAHEFDVLVVSLYVDNVMLTSSSEKLVKEFKASMQSKFEMTDLGQMMYFLGV